MSELEEIEKMTKSFLKEEGFEEFYDEQYNFLSSQDPYLLDTLPDGGNTVLYKVKTPAPEIFMIDKTGRLLESISDKFDQTMKNANKNYRLLTAFQYIDNEGKEILGDVEHIFEDWDNKEKYIDYTEMKFYVYKRQDI
jgi:hypothetical protein